MTRRLDDGDTLDWSDLMQLAAENVADSRWTMVPVRVLTFDPARACVDVQPVASVKGPDGQIRPMPPIFCSPVCYPAWGAYSVRAPAVIGDLGYLLVSSVSIAQWLLTGFDGAIPESPRRQSLSDAVYVGGLHSFAAPPTPTLGLVVGSDAAYVSITDPTVVLVEAPSIQLGLTAVDPLTLWPALETILNKIVDDYIAINNALNGSATAPVPALNYGLGVPPAMTPVAVPSAATSKVTGE